jgi:hypothetical protein
LPLVLPPVIVSPEMDAVTPVSTWNTRFCPPPLIVTPPAGPVIVSVPVMSLSSSWPWVRVIVWGVLKRAGANSIVSAPPPALACPTAQRKLPTLPSSSVFVTVIADSSVRSSIHSRRGLDRRQLGKGRSDRRRWLRGLGVFRMVVMVTVQSG